jgi:muramoyltetrapeptide carboxypeptidase LdcA involved in peptidoglycan recycling
MIRFPRPLEAGFTIAVTAPSSGVPEPMHRRLDLAIDALRARGFVVLEGHCLRGNVGQVSAPAHDRADELMRFLDNPSVCAVMPPWGGEFALELLPLIDFERLRAGVPKWFCGFSDLSTIQLPMLLNAGWASLHGPNLMELATPTELGDSIWEVLRSHPGDVVVSPSSRLHRRGYPNWITDPGAWLVPDAPTRWRRLDDPDSPITLQGRLLGGCLDTISRLAGTAFGNVPRFIADHAHEGVLLFLENAEMRPPELARALMSLRLHGWFEGVSGLLLGRDGLPEPDGELGFTRVDAISLALDGLAVPVLLDLDIGHVPPQLALIQGALTTVAFDGRGGRVTQRLA